MKRNNFVTPACLSMAVFLSFGAPLQVLARSPEFARTEEEWARLQDNVLEYEEIEDLVYEYNTTVLNNEQQYRRDRSKTSKDFVDDLLDQADRYWEAAGEAEDDMNTILNEISARQAETNAENNVDDGTTKYIQYTMEEKKIAIQAQTAMNTWYQLQYQLASLEKNRELLEAVLVSTQGQQGIGSATYSEVLTAQQNLQSADAQIAALKSQIETTRQNLIVMLGWPQSAFPEIRPMPNTDFEGIMEINVEEDTKKALEADYTLRLHKQNLENSTNDENKKIYQQSITDDEQQVAMAVSDAYQKVLQAKNSYDEAVMKAEVATKTWNGANTKYQVGTISHMEYLQTEIAMETAKLDVEIKNRELFQAMETYNWVVRGVRT